MPYRNSNSVLWNLKHILRPIFESFENILHKPKIGVWQFSFLSRPTFLHNRPNNMPFVTKMIWSVIMRNTKTIHQFDLPSPFGYVQEGGPLSGGYIKMIDGKRPSVTSDIWNRNYICNVSWNLFSEYLKIYSVSLGGLKIQFHLLLYATDIL